MSELAEKEKGNQGHGHLVTVTVDSVPKQIRQGRFRVADLTAQLGVSPELELDEVVDGEFRPLDDNSELNVKEGDVFVSHVRRGGAS